MNSIVAIVGRPNVGKSTLFNRLLGSSQAIVSAESGTTRDRVYATTSWGGSSFTLVDTGGLVTWGENPMQEAVRQQVEIAIAQADAIIFLVDAQGGVLPDDREIANLLRRAQRPVFLVANKVEGKKDRLAIGEFYGLGLGDPHPISAFHGLGVGDLLDEVVKSFPPGPGREEEGVRIAIVGRPNVGKSSLLNTLLGEERAIVTPQPGTTRDALDTHFTWEGQGMVLVDTAGIRRRGKVERGIEEYSVLRALRAIQRAQVVLLLLDATQGILAQDTHIAGYVHEAGRGLLLLVNKWDLIPDPEEAQADYVSAVGQAFRFVPYAPLFFISASTGEGIPQILPAALDVYRQEQLEIPARELNLFLQEAVSGHNPPSKAGKKLEFYSLRQVGVQPPSFLFQINDRRLLHFSYQRYLENRLRQAFGFQGTPIRLQFQPRRSKREAKPKVSKHKSFV